MLTHSKRYPHTHTHTGTLDWGWSGGCVQWPPSSQAQSFFWPDLASFRTTRSSSLRDFCSSSRNCFIHLFSCKNIWTVTIFNKLQKRSSSQETQMHRPSLAFKAAHEHLINSLWDTIRNLHLKTGEEVKIYWSKRKVVIRSLNSPFSAHEPRPLKHTRHQPGSWKQTGRRWGLKDNIHIYFQLLNK